MSDVGSNADRWSRGRGEVTLQPRRIRIRVPLVANVPHHQDGPARTQGAGGGARRGSPVPGGHHQVRREYPPLRGDPGQGHERGAENASKSPTRSPHVPSPRRRPAGDPGRIQGTRRQGRDLGGRSRHPRNRIVDGDPRSAPEIPARIGFPRIREESGTTSSTRRPPRSQAPDRSATASRPTSWISAPKFEARWTPSSNIRSAADDERIGLHGTKPSARHRSRQIPRDLEFRRRFRSTDSATP